MIGRVGKWSSRKWSSGKMITGYLLLCRLISGRGSYELMERSDTLTLGILGTLAHFRHFPFYENFESYK